jgi:glutamate synthase (NADPH) small chain
MGNPRGFLDVDRQEPGYRPKEERIKDFKEVEKRLSDEEIMQQASRCMDCGIPFCHGCGCTLSNMIPEFNDLIYQDKWREALEILLMTSSFPEFTGRICPALCEASCTLGINCEPVSIRQIEVSLIERGFKEGWLQPSIPEKRSGKRVAVVGSGPAGLAVANALNQMGHSVVVYERDAYVGGLLRYGIPDFKLDKDIIQRRINLMEQEGIKFETKVDIGNDISGEYLAKKFDAVCLTVGARVPRDLPIFGRELDGIHFAMDFLHQQNRQVSGEGVPETEITATGKKVVVIGGGDTGSDCVGTSIRQGAASVTQIEIMPEPPESRDESTPWPDWPYQKRTSSSHKEGCERLWNIMSQSFKGNGKVEKIDVVKVAWEMDGARPVKPVPVAASEFSIDADLVLLAMGFTGVEATGMVEQFNIKLGSRGGIETDDQGMTSTDGVFAAGDSVAGPSLVVRAMEAGRVLAANINDWLMI